MRETIDILKNELSGLIRLRRDRLEEITGNRSSQQRIDDYTSLLRDVLVDSSLCYLYDEGAYSGARLSFFDGRCYVPVMEEDVIIVLSNLLHDNGVGASDIRRIGDMPFNVIKERKHRVDSNKVCFSNCALDVSTGQILPSSKDIYTDYLRDFAYRVNAECPTWHKFLDEIMPDEDEQACLQEFFGMCYLDRNWFSVEKFAIFIGSGSNGKSVVFDVIKSIIGKERVSTLNPDQLTDEKQVVSVIGKRLNFAPDARKGASFDSALKSLASGQEVSGWKLYSGTTVVQCPPIVFALNELPRFRDLTSAFFRRVMLFSFDVTIPEAKQDRTLAARIVERESAGVFRWMMEGLWRLQDNKGVFTFCEKMENNLASLKTRVREDQNPVLQYLGSAGWSIEPVWYGQEYTKVPASTIFNGMKGMISKDAITRELNSLGVKNDRASERRYFLYRK